MRPLRPFCLPGAVWGMESQPSKEQLLVVLPQLLTFGQDLSFSCLFFFSPLLTVVFLCHSRCIVWGMVGSAAASSFLLCQLRIWSGVLQTF